MGGKQPKNNPDEIVGSEIIVHVSEEDAKKYDRIVGEEVNLIIGTDVDSQVRLILEKINRTTSPKKKEIVEYCQCILNEQNEESKLLWVRKLIEFGADVAQISSLVIQLATIIKI